MTAQRLALKTVSNDEAEAIHTARRGAGKSDAMQAQAQEEGVQDWAHHALADGHTSQRPDTTRPRLVASGRLGTEPEQA